jgi:ribosomal-protein-alanine N-acetyltransferase
MENQKSQESERSAGESLGQMLTAFGQAISEIFNDPELKAKAKEFADAATESAATLGRRFEDDDVKEKFRQAGAAAEDFGRAFSDRFKSGRNP